MKRRMRLLVPALLLALLMPLVISQAAFASPPDTVDGFVCPVVGGQAGGDHGNSSPEPIVPIRGDSSSVIGPEVTVPTHATNDNGAGRPDGAHAVPGDDDYTAIWGVPKPGP